MYIFFSQNIADILGLEDDGGGLFPLVDIPTQFSSTTKTIFNFW